MAEIARVSLLHDRRGWGVKVSLKKGGTRHYRYGSEAQARYFAAIFELGPRVLPAKPRARTRQGKRSLPATLPVERTGAAGTR
jgi:hypothetical protein